MEITNNTVSGTYVNDYKNKNMPKQDYENTMKMKMPETENKVLGIGFLHDKNNPISYGMCAKYAEDYSEDNPVIKVTVTKPNETDFFQSVKQDWMSMVQMMVKDYLEAGLYKQSLDGKGLLGMFERYSF